MDIKAMREKLNAMKKKGGPEHIWKPEEGETTIRIVPLKGNADNPFQVLYFHYNLGGKTYLSPMSYDERDPLAEFSDALIAEHTGRMAKEEFKTAKQFYPQARTYVPIIVRGSEKEGVKFWAFGKQTYEKLLAFIADDEYGDISDVSTGTDITVTFTPEKKSDTGFAKTDFVLKRKSSPLTTDKELLKTWLNDQPVLLDSFTKTTADELSKLLDKALSDPTDTATPTPVAVSAKQNDADFLNTPSVTVATKDTSAAIKELEDIFADKD